MYYVYGLYSECDAGLYIGYTCDDLHARSEQGPLGVVSPVDTL
jgi:predicted GIY-YIG superfamily endonuclease